MDSCAASNTFERPSMEGLVCRQTLSAPKVPARILTSHSLLGLDALYDPPRLMVSEATLDGPSATTKPNAEPQQGASTVHTTATPTAASDMVTSNSLGSSDSSSSATEQAAHPDDQVSTSVPGNSLETSESSSSDAEQATNSGDQVSASHTALMESQTPTLVAGTQSDASSTTGSNPVSNAASADSTDEGGSATASGPSTGAGAVFAMNLFPAVSLGLLLSYIAW